MKRVRFSDTPQVHELAAVEGDHDDVPFKKMKTQEEDISGGLKTEMDPTLAASKRARKRNSENPELDAEGELVDVEEAEEDFQHIDDAEEFGVPLEPFNMQREREEGHFNEVGNYVENKISKDDRDAWLDSLQGVQIDATLAQKLDAQAKRLQASSSNDDLLDEEDKVIYKKRVAALLERGETVLSALRRLGGGPKRGAGGRDMRQSRGNRRQKGAKGGSEGEVGEGKGVQLAREQQGEGPSTMSAENRSAFNRLTEFADSLLSNGEYNVYSLTREQLLESCGVAEKDEEDEHMEEPGSSAADPSSSAGAWGAAAVGGRAGSTNAAIASILASVEDGRNALLNAGGREEEGAVTRGIGSGGGAVAVDDDDMDMFGDDDEKDGKPGTGSVAGANGEVQGATDTASRREGSHGGAANGAGGTKAAAGVGGGDHAGGGKQEGGAGDGSFNGYKLDEASGYYYNSELGYWYDASSGLYGDAATGLWYTFSDGQYVLAEQPEKEKSAS